MIETRTINAQGVLVLPKLFANSTVTIEYCSETEIRVLRTADAPEVEPEFVEEDPIVLSAHDMSLFIEALENPLTPNAALQVAAARHRARHVK